MNENYIYTVGIPNTGKSYTYSVYIDKAVIESGYRYAEIERMVTGTNHVTVCDPEHYDLIDEEVFVSLDDNGDIIITDIGNCCI